MLLCFLSYVAVGQKVTMHDGTVWVHDTAYCSYQETYHPDANNADITERPGGEWNTAHICDYLFGTESGDRLIKLKAKKMAVPGKAFMYYFYNITFPDGREINVFRNAYLPEYFAKDLVHYDVFYAGNWDKESSDVMYNEWLKKDIVPAELMARSAVADYNTTPGRPVTDKEVSLRAGYILLRDTLIGSYKKDDLNIVTNKWKGNVAITIYGVNGKVKGRVWDSHPLAGNCQMTIGESEEMHYLTIADKSEENMVISAAKFLIIQHQLP